MATYNRIGKKYNLYRRGDERIIHTLIDLLGLPKKSFILDVGAGTGNYSRALCERGHSVWALEPSTVMMEQALPHPQLSFVQGYGEEIPFPEQSFHGVISVLASHHFSDREKVWQEMERVLTKDGSLALFVADPRYVPQDAWLREYFGDLFEKAESAYAPIDTVIDELTRAFGRRPRAEAFFLPQKMSDGFFCSGWADPRMYLKREFRRSISVLADYPQDHPSLVRLKTDIDSGYWDEEFGWTKKERGFHGGYFFLSLQRGE
jgi:ubiquinone/menaquinone biosynthesis C-methylase UbiE